MSDLWPNGEDCPCGRCMSIRGMYVAPASNAVAACPSCGSIELVGCPRTAHHDAECILVIRAEASR